MSIAVLGAGAFGTSLAIALAQGGEEIALWCRDKGLSAKMQSDRVSAGRLAGYPLPDKLTVTSDPSAFDSTICLIAVPTQSLPAFLTEMPNSVGALVACCKGIDQKTGLGPVETIQNAHPDARAAILTGPSFAVDIAQGLPTALLIAADGPGTAEALQNALTRPALRLYRSTDTIGAELGGALKNVIALAAGITTGAKLGDSARAALIARGFAEISRIASAKGADLETIHGLAGLGDLILTCSSEKSRNYSAGIALGRGKKPDPNTTIEGIATAQVVAKEARETGLDLPIIEAVAAVVAGELKIDAAIQALMSRPLGEE